MIVAAALLAAAPAGIFAPPTDRPLTIRREEEHRLGTSLRRFVAEYRLLFRRDGDGWLAELTLVALHAEAEAPIARRFLASSAGLRNRTLRFRLDAAGAPISLEGEAEAWAAAMRPLAALRPVGVPPLPDLPAAQRLAILAEPFAGLIAAGEAALRPGVAPVTLPGPDGALSGTRSVARAGDRLVLETRAGDTGRGIVVERVRTVDPATGLAIRQEEVTRLGRAGANQITHSVTTLTG